jgi:AmiR/NasT family two-component response regulator
MMHRSGTRGLQGSAHQTIAMPRPHEPESRAGDQGRAQAPAQQSPTKAFRDLKIAVIAERDPDGERLIRELQRLHCVVHHEWPMPPQIPSIFDVVFCVFAPDLPQRLSWIPGDPASTLIVIDPGYGQLDLKPLNNCAPHAVLHYPVTARSMQVILAVARSHFLYERRLRLRIDKLDENLRTMRSVERAKSLLIRLKNVSEEEAYNYLRRQAMERRVTIGAVANAIIDSFELLG